MTLVVFDCDGTLVDSQHMIVAAMDRAFDSAGLPPVPRAAVLSVVGLSLTRAVAQLAPGLPAPAIEDLAERYKSAFHVLRRDAAHQEPLYPGVREALAGLAARPGVRLGIATGKSRRGVAVVLEREGLADMFQTIQTADTNPSKPDPAMLLTAMAETGAEPHETMMIGDTTFDIEMARAAGVRAIGVGWGYHPIEELEAAGADRLIAQSEDLGAGMIRELALRTAGA